MITRKAFSRASGAVLAAVGTLLLLHSLWQLAAGWALRAELKAEAQAGLPGSLQDLTPPAVKPEDNAAVLLQTAFALMQKDRGVSPESHPLVKEIIQCRLDVGPDREGRDLRTLDADAKRALQQKLRIEPVVTILTLLREAAEKPACNFELDFGKGPAVFLPHLIHLQSAIRLLIADAWLKAQEGDLSGCLSNLHVCLRLAHHLRDEPLLFSLLVRVKCETLTIECLYEVLNRNSPAKIPPEEARMLFAELYRHLDPENRCFIRALDGERICFGSWFFHGILSSRLKRKDLADLGLRDTPRLYTNYFWRPLLKMEFRRYLQAMRRYRKAVGQPYPIATSEMQAVVSLPRYCAMARRMLSAGRTAYRAAVHHQALVEMARLGLGLCFHHRSHNSYPVTLEELKSFPRLLLDPFTASPFRYTKAGDGYVLRSAGPNGCEEADGAKSDDLVWRITAGH